MTAQALGTIVDVLVLTGYLERVPTRTTAGPNCCARPKPAAVSMPSPAASWPTSRIDGATNSATSNGVNSGQCLPTCPAPPRTSHRQPCEPRSCCRDLDGNLTLGGNDALGVRKARTYVRRGGQ